MRERNSAAALNIELNHQVVVMYARIGIAILKETQQNKKGTYATICQLRSRTHPTTYNT